MARRTAEPITEALAKLADDPTDKLPQPAVVRAAELVKAAAAENNGNTNGDDEPVFREIRKTIQRIDLLRSEANWMLECQSLLTRARRHSTALEPVDHDLIRKLVVVVNNWTSQVGALDPDGGS